MTKVIRNFRISISLLVLALVALSSTAAMAQSRPFHLVEHGTLASDQPGHIIAEGTGTATHLGSIVVHRTFTLTPFEDGSGLLEVRGQATLVAANGDQLESTIIGTLNPVTGHAVLIYEWTGGTGRFENATGTSTWQVDVDGGTYDVVADGVINF